MNRRLLWLLPVAALSALGVACGGDDDASAPGDAAGDAPANTVVVKTFAFQPDPITVSAGETVVFRNEDAIDHTVTAGTRAAPTPDRFDGQLPDKGATFELTLEEPGTYDYFCAIHPGEGMTGVIEVVR